MDAMAGGAGETAPLVRAAAPVRLIPAWVAHTVDGVGRGGGKGRRIADRPLGAPRLDVRRAGPVTGLAAPSALPVGLPRLPMLGRRERRRLGLVTGGAGASLGVP